LAKAPAAPGKQLQTMVGPLQILRGCGEQYLVSRPAQTSQPKPVKPQDALHMCKPHLYLLALAA
jgi:hypothetical protein